MQYPTIISYIFILLRLKALFNHKVNRPQKYGSHGTRLPAGLGLQSLRPVLDEQTGFINHPSGFPLEIRPVRLSKQKTENPVSGNSRLGLLFKTDIFIKPGQSIGITIPLGDANECFVGRVVLVRHQIDHFEIGLCLTHPDAISRLRIVEQICHIEAYLHQKKFTDGPYTINRDLLTREWIAQYAAKVPSL